MRDRHIRSAIVHFDILTSDSSCTTPKTLEMTTFTLLRIPKKLMHFGNVTVRETSRAEVFNVWKILLGVLVRRWAHFGKYNSDFFGKFLNSQYTRKSLFFREEMVFSLNVWTSYIGIQQKAEKFWEEYWKICKILGQSFSEIFRGIFSPEYIKTQNL